METDVQEERGEHAVLVVDCSTDSWSTIGELAEQDVAPARRCNVGVTIESCHLLETAIKLFHADNRTTVIAAGIQPRPVASARDLVNECTNSQVSVVKALTIALSVINRDQKERASATTDTRIILITATKIPSFEFVSCMNCAFAAQKMGVVIDVVDYSQAETPELLQLVHHTQGWYLGLEPKDGAQGTLAHAMLSHFVAGVSARKCLNPPASPATDLRTICFCHKDKLISVGFVCSVCLHVFCEKRNVCSACNSRVAVNLKLRNKA